MATGTNRDAEKVKACVSISLLLNNTLQITFHSSHQSQIDGKSTKHLISSQRNLTDAPRHRYPRVRRRPCVQIWAEVILKRSGYRDLLNPFSYSKGEST